MQKNLKRLGYFENFQGQYPTLVCTEKSIFKITPTQADSVPKVLATRKEVRRVFLDEDDAWAARIRGYTMQRNLFALLQAKSEGTTWKSYMWKNTSIDTLPTFTNLKRWGSVPLSTAISMGTL
jgi:hypothetical protein